MSIYVPAWLPRGYRVATAWLPRGYRVALTAAVVAIAASGCAEPTGSLSDPRASPVRAVVPPAANIDEAFLQVADKVGAFAGAYFDEKGVLVVRLVDPADSLAAWSAVRQLLISRVRVDERRTPLLTSDEQLAPNGRRVERAATTFKQLHELKSRIGATVFDLDEVVSLDLDERTGRVVVGMLNADGAGMVIDSLRLTTSERSLVDFKSQQIVKPARQQTVNWRHRPLTGGYQIGPGNCTMTLGAMRGSEQLMLTASHCTATVFAPDGGPTRQNFNQTQTFGAEVTDPYTYSCGTWISPKRCRRADAAAYDVASVDLFASDSIGWVPGRIARTLTATSGSSQQNGSFVIDQNNPYWTVIAEIAYPLQGEVMHKVGQSTGWTYGAVFATCQDEIQSGTNVKIVCNDEANTYGAPGDSGSPLFAPYGGYVGTVAFYGVLWGVPAGSAVVVFSNFTQMKQDLGYLRLF